MNRDWQSARTLKSRPCSWCGQPACDPFCKRCYRLTEAETKASMRALFAQGWPKRAIRVVVHRLESLAASGVPVPARRERPWDEETMRAGERSGS